MVSLFLGQGCTTLRGFKLVASSVLPGHETPVEPVTGKQGNLEAKDDENSSVIGWSLAVQEGLWENDVEETVGNEGHRIDGCLLGRTGKVGADNRHFSQTRVSYMALKEEGCDTSLLIVVKLQLFKAIMSV